ncbi:MAG: pyridoxamine 5'-phosphate oxidase family protein [Chloroflexota bacterium]
MKPMPRLVKDFVRRAPVCRVATVQPNGKPYVGPVCHVFDGTFVYIDVAPNGKTATGVKENGRITLTIDDYYQNWRRLKGVIIEARAHQARGEAKKKAWRMIRRKFPQSVKAEWDPRLTLVLKIEDWSEWGVIG